MNKPHSGYPRREFFARTALVLVGGTTVLGVLVADTDISVGGEMSLIVSTWGFGKPANEAARKILIGGGTILDAVA